MNWRGFFAAPGLPDDKLAMYQDAIAKMYDTPEWEAVRARNGWVNIHNPDLKNQIGKIMQISSNQNPISR